MNHTGFSSLGIKAVCALEVVKYHECYSALRNTLKTLGTGRNEARARVDSEAAFECLTKI